MELLEIKKGTPVFKNRLRFFIDEHRLTDIEAAAGMGISRNTLFRLTSGDFKRLDADTVFRAMRFFGVPFDRLFYVDLIDNDDPS